MNCNRTKMWVLYSILIVIAICSCHSECEDNTHSNEYRTKFSEEELNKWIKFQDSIQFFKRTEKGKTDTILGVYKYSTDYSSLLGDNGCYVIYHSRAAVSLFFSEKDFQYLEMTIGMSNYEVEPYELTYRGTFYKPGDKLDTAFVNGKIYHNVIKFYENNRVYFLASGIGWIYIYDGYRKFELIPK